MGVVAIDLAVREDCGAGDVVEVLVTQQDDKARDARGLERVADEAGVLDGDVRVVDQRLVAVDDRVAGDAQRRVVVDPVRAFGEAVALYAAVVERDDPVGGAKDAHVVHGGRIISVPRLAPGRPGAAVTAGR